MSELVNWGWVADHTGDIAARTWEHVTLTFFAVVVGFAISLPVGIYAHRHRKAYPLVASLAGFLYTIPSLALFAFLVPFTGLSTLTAEIGLVSYTLLILIRNVVAGLEGVPLDAKDSATGMGYGTRQLLWRVEVPLALPVIFAGIRIATVTTVGLVTVTAFVGKGGLGRFIRDGLQEFFYTEAIVGAVLSVVLAVIADRVLVVAERFVTPWSQRQTSVARI